MEIDKLMKVKKYFSPALLLVIFLMTGCGSYHIKPNITAQERFELAKLMFSKRDYFEAKNQFKILVLNNPGLPFIDEAQYYLAESHFHMKEYILAADEYNRLIRLYPKSDWVDDASFKIGMCDYKLSPKPSLDPKYTIQAVQHFQTFIEDFPNSDLIPEAERLLKKCRSKLAEKDYKTGVLYRKLGDYHAAIVYFDSVLENYYDSKYADDAQYWKAECLFKSQKKQESLQAFLEFISKYPKNPYSSKSISRIKKLEEDLAKIKNANGVSSNTKVNE